MLPIILAPVHCRIFGYVSCSRTPLILLVLLRIFESSNCSSFTIYYQPASDLRFSRIILAVYPHLWYCQLSSTLYFCYRSTLFLYNANTVRYIHPFDEHPCSIGLYCIYYLQLHCFSYFVCFFKRISRLGIENSFQNIYLHFQSLLFLNRFCL